MDIAVKLQEHSLGPCMHPELQDDVLLAIIEIERLRAALVDMIDGFEGAVQWCSGCDACRAAERRIAMARSALEQQEDGK